MAVTDPIIVRAASVYADLHRRGELIGDADILIAATAMSYELTVDHVRAVIIISIRRRNEGTYKDIPTKSLSDKTTTLEAQMKAMVPLIKDLAGRMGIEWVSQLSDNHIRCLEIGIKVMREKRGSCTAERIEEIISIKEDVRTIATDMRRLLKKIEKHRAF